MYVSFKYAMILVILAPMAAAMAAEPAQDPPSTLFWDGQHLAQLRERDIKNDPFYAEVAKRLRKNAEIALGRGPYSVMDKADVPPSGDKHDYISYAPYWWPNPETADGLPYIRRDGKTNEAITAKGDGDALDAMCEDLESAALAGYLLDEPRYSEHAAKLVRAWFLDPATRMNPRLEYAQAIPGRNDGRNAGIIESRGFIQVLESVALLEQSDSWSEADSAAMKQWMGDYLDWLQTSAAGQRELHSANNHGTWCNALNAYLALYTGREDLARKIIAAAKTGRIERTIEPDGRQPEEITRTKSLHYHVFNLSGLVTLARLGEHVDVDLWSYESSDGRSIRRAFGFITPYLIGDKVWPHAQIVEMKIAPTNTGMFYLAARRYHEPKYRQCLQEDGRRPAKFEYTRLEFPIE